MPVGGMSEWTTMPVTVSRVRFGAQAGQFDVAETVEGELRLLDFVALALEDVGVGGAGGAEVRGTGVPSGLSTSA